MGSSIILKLLKVTHYYRNHKHHKWYLPFGYHAKDIDLNNVTLHIYQGESLGIIGEPGSSKSLIGQILAGAIKPDKGKVLCDVHRFFGDIEDLHIINQTIFDYVTQIVQYFPYKANDHKVDQIIRYAHLEEQQHDYISNLDYQQFAQLLFSVARSSKANIIILNGVISHLPDTYLDRAVELAQEYIDHNQTLIMIDNHIDRIVQLSNYIAWFSHGQLRMEGSVNQVIPLFKEHEHDRLSLNTKEEQRNFDIDWKKSRSKIPEMTYNFKRVERYNHIKVPTFLVRFWTLFSTILIGLVIMGVLLFNNIGIVSLADNTNQETIQTHKQDAYNDTLAYGFVLGDSIKVSGASQVNLPQYSMMTITGENSKNYRLDIDGKAYYVNKDKLEYFNPAGLYETYKLETLAPYMKSNYVKYIDYFNSHLHKSHDTVTKTLVPEKDNRFVTPITQQPIKMLFNDDNHLNGFVYPIVNKEKLRDKFNINQNIWIAKVGNGYCIANMKEDKWIYIEL